MTATGRQSGRTPWLRPVVRWAGVLAAVAIAVLALWGRLPGPAEIAASLQLAETGWLVVAAAAEIVSMGMFARQQRRLLTAFGVTMPRHRALALAYSRSAISISLPAGSAVSAAYAFRQFRTGGASRSAAATIMVLSGLLSLVALVLLYVTGLLAAGVVHLAAAWRAHPALTELAIVTCVGMMILIAFLAWPQRSRRRSTERPNADALGSLSVRTPRLATLVRPVVDAVRDSRSVPGRHWGLALAAAAANWLTDLLCLAAAARAFHLPLNLASLAAIYLTVQIVRQIPLTPGGIGVIELSLLAGLISAGAAEAPATATVLVYRLLSCWLIIPIGMLGWLILRRPQVRSRTSTPSPQPPPRQETPPAPRPVPPPYPSMAARG